MAEEITAQEQTSAAIDVGPIYWWSWRPGIKPHSALLIGGLISCMALVLVSIGLVALVLAFQHSLSPPPQVPGIVTNHTVDPSGGLFLSSVALLLLGLILLSYPAVLANWGWLDLYGHNKEHRQREMTAKVVGLRAAAHTRASRTGLTPRPSRTWYGIALYPMSSLNLIPTALGAMNLAPAQRVMTFAINEHLYRSLHEGQVVRLIYSYHLHYVYTLAVLP